jgi:glucose-6-phosphate 1-epimerase
MDGGEVEMILIPEPGEASRAVGFDAFYARYRVVVGTVLRTELTFQNLSALPVRYEDALQSYFSVGDIRQTSVTGLEGTVYLDKANGFRRKVQGSEPVRFSKETDQVHIDTSAACVIEDAANYRWILLQKSGSNSTIVWNPWQEKAAAMADMGSGEWERMVCVESGNATANALTLAPGASHTLSTVISLQR